MTEFTRSIKLLNGLKNDDDVRQRFQDDPDALLLEFGIEGEEGDRFKNRFEDGDLHVLGWTINGEFRVFSPWPMLGTDRVVREVTPNPVKRNVETEIVIVGSGFRVGDRVGFRLQGGTVDVEAHEVEIVGGDRVRAKLLLTTLGAYDMVVGRMASAGWLNAGMTVIED